MSPDLYSRLVDDPGFRRRVEAHYRGDDDLVDVAWWLNHPDEDSPSGRPSPAHAIRELQHQLYARSTSEEDRHKAAEALRELQENVAASKALLMEAVARAEAHLAPVRAASDAEAPRPRRWWPLAAAGGAAIIAAIGFGAGSLAADSNAALASSPPTASPTPARPEVVAALDQPQTPEDMPEWIPAGFKNETFRSVTQQQEESGGRTFIARDETNMICLVVVVTQPAQQLFSSCALEHDIPIGGLRVQYRENVQGADGALATELLAYVTLKHDSIEGGHMATPIQQ